MDFEQLRLIDLIEKFQSDLTEISATRSLKTYNGAGQKLQSVYNFLLASQSAFEKEQELLKNLFSSFNYGAVIVNNALKTGGLSPEDNELLGECLEIMLTCCTKLINMLKQ